jgi:hypothetical protein
MTSRKGTTLSYRDLSPENIDWKHNILTNNQKDDPLVFPFLETKHILSTPNGLTHPKRRKLSPSLQPLTLITTKKVKRETLWT